MPLRPAQKHAIDSMRRGKRGLFLPYGHGKSRPAIEYALEYSATRRQGRATILVFCPPRLINNWIQQIELWASHDTTIAYYDGEWHVHRYGERAAFAIVPYTRMRKASVRNMVATLHNLTVALVDESRAIANPASQAGKGLNKLALQTRIPMIVISGNPMPESRTEIWNQLAVAYGTRNPFGKSFYAFRERYFQQQPFGGWTPIVTGDLWREFDSKYRSCAIKWKQRGAGLPEETYHVRLYDPSAGQLASIEQLTETWRLDVPDGRLELPNAAAVASKVRQLLSGFVYVTDIDGVKSSMQLESVTPKFEAARDLISELLDRHRKIIVWRYYREEDRPLRLMAEHVTGLPVCVGLCPSSVDAFANSDARVLIAPVGAGEGLNGLTVATADLYYSSTYSADRRVQAERRIARLGQTSTTVEHWDLAARNTVEESIVGALQRKTLDNARLSATVSTIVTGSKKRCL